MRLYLRALRHQFSSRVRMGKLDKPRIQILYRLEVMKVGLMILCKLFFRVPLFFMQSSKSIPSLLKMSFVPQLMSTTSSSPPPFGGTGIVLISSLVVGVILDLFRHCFTWRRMLELNPVAKELQMWQEKGFNLRCRDMTWKITSNLHGGFYRYFKSLRDLQFPVCAGFRTDRQGTPNLRKKSSL